MSNLISMDTVKQLREKSGAGMVDCKKALEESVGDPERAIEILRKKGILKAAKREGREAKEGIILIATNENASEGYMLELNAETDFVARNEQFRNFGDKVLNLIKIKKPVGFDALMALTLEDGATVKENLDNLSGVIGEKIGIKNFSIINSKGTVSAYSHLGGKIGVLISLDKKGKEELARDLAMQIAAANPKYVSPENVPADEVNKEKEIYGAQLKKEGKPENIIEKILAGKIAKYYEDVCLVKQEYIKDDSKKVEDILGEVKVENFFRYSLHG